MSSFFENVYEYSVLYKQIIYCWKKYTFLGANLWHLSYTGWFKKMDSISYVYISWTIQGMWTISITFERGGEVKPSVPCRKFTACKRTQKWRGSRHFRQNSRKFLAHNSTFRRWGSLASFQTWETPDGGSWNVLITVLQVGGLTCHWQRHSVKNLPAENTQR